MTAPRGGGSHDNHLECGHQAPDFLPAEDAEQVVLETQEVSRASWVALPTSSGQETMKASFRARGLRTEIRVVQTVQ